MFLLLLQNKYRVNKLTCFNWETGSLRLLSFWSECIRCDNDRRAASMKLHIDICTLAALNGSAFCFFIQRSHVQQKPFHKTRCTNRSITSRTSRMIPSALISTGKTSSRALTLLLSTIFTGRNCKERKLFREQKRGDKKHSVWKKMCKLRRV